MATHAHSTSTSRRPTAGVPGSGRRTLSTLAAMVRNPVLGMSAVPTPDAGLIRLCAASHDADAPCHAAPDDGAEWRIWLNRRQAFSEQIEAMTPTTFTGRLAKARVALLLLEEVADLENASERFAVVALRNLVTGGAA